MFVRIKNTMKLLNNNHFLRLNRAAIVLIAAAVFFMSVSSVSAQSAFDDPGSRSKAGKGGDLTAVEAKIDAGSVSLGSSSQVVILLRNDGAKPIKSGTISPTTR